MPNTIRKPYIVGMGEGMGPIPRPRYSLRSL